MQKIIEKLDLNDYIDSFKEYLAREKPIILEGDINLHFKIIEELEEYEFNPPKKVENLDKPLIHIQKQGILKSYEIYEFIKIIKYFLYLKIY